MQSRDSPENDSFTQKHIYSFDNLDCAFLTSLRRLLFPKAPAPPQGPKSPRRQAQSVWLAPAFQASRHWSADLSFEELEFLITERVKCFLFLLYYFYYNVFCPDYSQNLHLVVLNSPQNLLPLGVSLFPMGQMIFLMQYSERMPWGPKSLRLIISVVIMSVSVVSKDKTVPSFKSRMRRKSSFGQETSLVQTSYVTMNENAIKKEKKK